MGAMGATMEQRRQEKAPAMGSLTSKEQQHQWMNLYASCHSYIQHNVKSTRWWKQNSFPHHTSTNQQKTHTTPPPAPPSFEQIEFPISLVRLALAQECNISQRHSAAVLLKSYVDTQWSEKSSRFTGPEPPAEVLQQQLRFARKLMATTGDLV